MTPEEAIEYVAEQVAADLLDDPFDHWDGYPEIGESDWHRISDAVQRRAYALRPQHKLFEEAYELITSRNGNE